MRDDITAVVLAGGLGTRLRSEVADRPKVLAEVAGQPFIERIFAQLEDFGVTKVVLCVGYMADKIEELYGTSYGSLSISYSHENTLLGTAGAVRFALKSVHTAYALVLNGDSFCSFDLNAFEDYVAERNAHAAVLLTQVDDTGRYGSVVVNELGAITSFIEKSGAAGAGLINAGVYLIKRSVIAEIPVGRVLSLEKDIFPSWIGRGFYGFAASSRLFIDIGTPQSFHTAQTIFLPEVAK
jgi:D-glycero-alpha-D-manno-heptose 1-phosphate guanylyltransferase